MNLIWIISDTLRRGDIGCYGNKKIYTPSLDALADKSIRFGRHYAANFPTMPARADYATGRWTLTYMGWEPLLEDQITLAEILRQNGFHTAAVVDTPFYLRNGMNYNRGFHTFFESSGQTSNRGETLDIRAGWRYEADRYAPQTFIKAMQWLERHYKEDFFLVIDAWDPHEPWDAPGYYTELYWPGYDGEIIHPIYGYWRDVPGFTEERVRKAHATYCGEITMVDTWLGYFLRNLGNMNLMENTAIIFTTDHGFYFGEHAGLFGKLTYAKRPNGGLYRVGEAGASWTHSLLYEELVAIPLFIYVPHTPPGNYGGLTSAIDLMPTVLNILEQEIPDFVDGKSLLPMIRDSSVPGREFVVSAFPLANPGDTVRWIDDQSREIAKASTITITTDEWTLLYAVDPGLSELYHLPSDPNQEKNIINKSSDVAKELHQLLVKFMRENNVESSYLDPRLELKLYDNLTR